MNLYQILVPLVCLFFMYDLVRQYLKKNSSLFELIVWMSVWIGISVAALIPDFITGKLANWLGIKSNINAIVFMALGILFFLVYRLSLNLRRIESNMVKLVRELARLEQKNEKNSDEDSLHS